jgi:hypothetical protein
MVDPKRAKLLILMEEPKAKKSRVDKLDPNFMNP